MSYRETFVTLPVTTRDGEEELTVSAFKITAIRGGAKSTTVTYEDGDQTARIVVPLPASEVRERVMGKMTEWA